MSVASIAAVAWVEERTVVVRSNPFHLTLDPETKPVPVTVRVNAAPPAVADEGESEVMVGVGLLTVKVFPVDVPPPGAGLKTVTVGVPAVAMSVASMEAVACVEEMTLVVRSTPFHRTLAPETNPVPVTVRVNAVLPAMAELGESVEMAGIGLFAAVTENAAWLEVPPPGVGLLTVTYAVVTEAMSVARIVAVSWVEEM